MTKELKVSVIIPVHNGGACFQECLSSLRNAVSNDVELIVVADGDADSGNVAEKFGAKVVFVPVRSGRALARNLGAPAARGAILFL